MNALGTMFGQLTPSLIAQMFGGSYDLLITSTLPFFICGGMCVVMFIILYFCPNLSKIENEI